MHFRFVPAVTARYWAAITLASIFGANLGDFVSRPLHMGHVRGLPFIAAAFGLIALGSWLSRSRWEGWYWLAIIAARTAATNLADLAAHDSAFGTGPVSFVLAILLAAIVLIRHAVAPEAASAETPRADTGFWLAMLTAGTLGTALGDGIAGSVGLAVATVLTAVAVAIALGLRARSVVGLATGYWLAIVAIRTFGTNAGDWIAHALGLAVATPLTGVAFVILLAAWRERAGRVRAIPVLES